VEEIIRLVPKIVETAKLMSDDPSLSYHHVKSSRTS